MKLPGRKDNDFGEPPTLAVQIKQQFLESVRKVNELKDELDRLQVKDQDSMDRAIQLDADAKNLIKGVKERLAQVIKKPEAFVKTAKGIAKGYIDILTLARNTASRKMIDYNNFLEIARKKQAALIEESTKKLQEAIDEQAKESGVPAPRLSAPPPPPEEKTIRSSSGETVTFRKYWTYEIVNPDEVERDLCDPSPRKIQERIKGGMREAKGLRIFEAEGTATRG